MIKAMVDLNSEKGSSPGLVSRSGSVSPSCGWGLGMVCLWDSLKFKENRGLKQAWTAQIKAFSGGSHIPSMEFQPFSTAGPFSLGWPTQLLASPSFLQERNAEGARAERGSGLQWREPSLY